MSDRLRSKRRSIYEDPSENEEDENIEYYESISSNVVNSTRMATRSCFSQDSGRKGMKRNAKIVKRNAFSQESSSNNSGRLSNVQLSNAESKNINIQEELDLARRVIQYMFTMEKKKNVITKVLIIKNVLGGSKKNLNQIMERVKLILSEVFGYKLVDKGSNKYIMVNELDNSIPHLNFDKSIKSQQVLLFIILSHIFMYEDVTTEETLWDFLRRLEIIKEDNFHHDYFGDVKKLVTMDFVAQQYLEKTMVYKGDSQKYEYKWGPRAEYEVSYRDVLKFVSRVYGGRPISSWPLQYKTMLEKEQPDET